MQHAGLARPLPRPAARRHALATLRHRDFRLLWIGQLCSTAGQQMQMVVIGWHVYVLTDSPFQLGLVGLLRAVPFMTLSIVGGATADLVDRKRLLLLSQGSLAVLTGLLAASTAGGAITPWGLYLATLLAGAAFAFDSPTREALIPTLVPRQELTNALTLATLARKAANIAAPGLAGLVIGQLGLDATYAMNAACFLLVIGAVLLMRPPKATTRRVERGWGLVMGGLRYARQEPLVLAALAMDFSVAFLANPWALLPVFARDVLRVGPQGLGLLHASASAGAVTASLAMGAISGVRRPVPVMLAASAAQGLFVLAFGLSPLFALSAALLYCAGVANVVAEVLRATVVQLRTPDELRGRVMALSLVFTNGGPYLGFLQAGAAASLLGPVAAAALGGAAAVLAVAGFARLPPMRRGAAEEASSPPSRPTRG